MVPAVAILKTWLKLMLGRGVAKSYAQNGEDILLRTVIGNARDGTYVEVGAFHPIQYSNTYALYRRGWKGLMIDANPDPEILFKVFRPRDVFITTAIGTFEGERTYYRFEDAAYNTLSDSQAQEWLNRGVKLVGKLKVNCRPLSRILVEQKIKQIDVLSVDAEGLDLEVLKSHDWDIPTTVIVAESHNFNIQKPEADPIYSFLRQKGYHLAAYAGFSLIFKKSA